MDLSDAPITPDFPQAASPEVMRGLLRGNADWLRGDPQLLAELGLRLDAANIVDFGPVALSRVSAAHQRESSARKRLETMARANFAAQTQTHAAVIDVLRSRSLADMAERVDQLARLRFGLAFGGLAVEGGETPPGWVTLVEGQTDLILGRGGQCGARSPAHGRWPLWRSCAGCRERGACSTDDVGARSGGGDRVRLVRPRRLHAGDGR